MKAWRQNKPCLVVMVIVRCDVKVKGGLHATICRRDRHLTGKSYIICKLASDEKRRVLKMTLIT